MKISAYTTTRNIVSLDYSTEECVKSLLGFADEVIIFDTSDQNDGTADVLSDLQKFDSRIKVFHEDWNYSVPNFGIFDGMGKAKARSLCSSDSNWLVPCDSDEIFHEFDQKRVRLICNQIEDKEDILVLANPTIEYWGSEKQIRIDVNPWKERLSRNLPNITHGIPSQLRVIKDGLLYSKPGSDGCNLIDSTSGNPIPIVGFMSNEAEMLRQLAVKDSRYISHFENYYNDIINNLPPVHHFSWFSIERKIRTYSKYWNLHWKSLYGEELTGSNMFFDVPWTEVTEEMIVAKAKELREKTVGHVFHQKFNGVRNNGVQLYSNPPEIMRSWMDRNKDV